MINVVRREFGGRLSLTHAAHIGGNHPVTGVGQCANLSMPAEPQVRKAMAQNHRHALALLHIVHIDAVDGGIVVLPVHNNDSPP